MGREDENGRSRQGFNSNSDGHTKVGNRSWKPNKIHVATGETTNMVNGTKSKEKKEGHGEGTNVVGSGAKTKGKKGRKAAVKTSKAAEAEPMVNSDVTHDEAMRVAHVMGFDTPDQTSSKDTEHDEQLHDTLLREMPSFDLSDVHSLSHEDVMAGDDHMLDLIGKELIPWEIGGDGTLPDFSDLTAPIS